MALTVAGAISLATVHWRGCKLMSVQTASMLPAIRPGDALVVAPVSVGQLGLGDIISYQSPRNPSVIISHRLVAIDKRTGWITTAGDALPVPDPKFPSRLVVGRAIAVAPKLGVIIDALRRPIGLALAIYLPATFIIVAEGRRLARAYARAFYSARL